jgi:hypothetical protein
MAISPTAVNYPIKETINGLVFYDFYHNSGIVGLKEV